jgi:hypothetical protein
VAPHLIIALILWQMAQQVTRAGERNDLGNAGNGQGSRRFRYQSGRGELIHPFFFTVADPLAPIMVVSARDGSVVSRLTLLIEGVLVRRNAFFGRCRCRENANQHH